MVHNVLARRMEQIPMWLLQALIGILLTSGVAWATWASVSTWKHETRIAVVETRADDIDRSLTEIKDGQKDINHKLDRLLEQRNHGR